MKKQTTQKTQTFEQRFGNVHKYMTHRYVVTYNVNGKEVKRCMDATPDTINMRVANIAELINAAIVNVELLRQVR